MSKSTVGTERMTPAGYILIGVEIALTIVCVVLGTGVTLVDSENELRYFGLVFFAVAWAAIVIPVHFVNRGFFGQSLLRRYKDWVGRRSFIMQSVLLIWTVWSLSFCVLLIAASFVSGGSFSDLATEEVTAEQMCILLSLVGFGVYSLVALPFVIAAFATRIMHPTSCSS